MLSSFTFRAFGETLQRAVEGRQGLSRLPNDTLLPWQDSEAMVCSLCMRASEIRNLKLTNSCLISIVPNSVGTV